MKLVWEKICDNQFSVKICYSTRGSTTRLQNSCKRRENSSISGHLELKRRRYCEHKQLNYNINHKQLMNQKQLTAVRCKFCDK